MNGGHPIPSRLSRWDARFGQPKLLAIAGGRSHRMVTWLFFSPTESASKRGNQRDSRRDGTSLRLGDQNATTWPSSLHLVLVRPVGVGPGKGGFPSSTRSWPLGCNCSNCAYPRHQQRKHPVTRLCIIRAVRGRRIQGHQAPAAGSASGGRTSSWRVRSGLR